MTELMGPKMPWQNDRPRRVRWSFHRSGKIKGVVSGGNGPADEKQQGTSTDHPGKDDPGRKPAQQRG
jgi:hypothetical protein